MHTTIREFQRQFRKIRQRAKAGEEIVITDAEGISYSFKAQAVPASCIADQAGDIVGSYRSGKKDLASHPRHMASYGRR